jgi:putative toxin-antitoxin system antitoxin component (TIGR02293 family)
LTFDKQSPTIVQIPYLYFMSKPAQKHTEPAIKKVPAPKEPIPITRARKSADKKLGPEVGVPAGSARVRKLNTKEKSELSYTSTDDKGMLSIIDLVREGVSAKDFDAIVDKTPFTPAEWAGFLQLSERTMQRYRESRKPFQPIQSERIVELAMLYNYGLQTFGEQQKFNAWLEARSLALGGRTPKELLDTKFGISMIRDALVRIEHGVLA